MFFLANFKVYIFFTELFFLGILIILPTMVLVPCSKAGIHGIQNSPAATASCIKTHFCCCYLCFIHDLKFNK